MVAGRHHPHGVDHLAKACAASKQLKGNLGVRQLAQSLQELSRLLHSAESVPVAVLRGADGTAKQLEVAVPNNLEVRRERGNVNRRARAGSKDDLRGC